MNACGKVLVFGDDTRSFLASVRSLGRRGIEVHAAPFALDAPALKSRYISKIHLLPYYLDGGQAWLEAVQRLFEVERYDLIIPCEERTLLPLCMHRAELAPLCRLAIPDEVALNAFFDKSQTRALADAQGVPVAHGRSLREDDTPELIAAEFGLPLIAKPKKSFSWPNLYVRNSAQLLKDHHGIAGMIAAADGHEDEVLLERVFAGVGLGVSVLCHDGIVLQAFEHLRAHELFGSSFYRCSAPLHPERLSAVKAMVRELAYTGIAMFEFKHNEASGEWVLLEVNARPWGSLPLPVSLGVDFPYGLYRILVKGEMPAEVVYPIGRYARNFIPDLWQMRAAVSAHASRPLALTGLFLHWLWGFRRRLLGTETVDVNVPDDRAPARAEMRQFLHERFSSLFRGLFRAAPDFADALRRFDALLAGQAEVRILFLCQGNICRSPYAEYRLRSVLGGDSLVRVSSAGMLPRNRRPSPAHALEAAHAVGIDLAPHRSQHAGYALVSEATLILVFDEINRRSFRARYPELMHKMIPLSAFGSALGGVKDSGIQDPEGRGVQSFNRVYQEIDACVAQLAAKLRQKTSSGSLNVQ